MFTPSHLAVSTPCLKRAKVMIKYNKSYKLTGEGNEWSGGVVNINIAKPKIRDGGWLHGEVLNEKRANGEG